MSNPSFSSRWIGEFEKQALRRKHIVLYGNIHDLFMWRGVYQSVNEILLSYFRDLDYKIICQYNLVDGLRFMEHDNSAPGGMKMRDLYDDIIRKALGVGSPIYPSSPNSPPMALPGNPAQPPPRGIPGREAAQSQSSRMLEAKDFFADMGKVLSQSGIPVAAIADITDMITSGTNNYSADERQSLMRMKKCTLEASLLDSGSLSGYRNMLVIVANELKRLPEWIYRDNPYVELIEITSPDREERYQFGMQFIRPNASGAGGFYEGDKISLTPANGETTSELSLVADEFADLTSGMHTMDLETLRIVSWQAEIPIRRKAVNKLIDFFKFGKKEDPWEKLNSERVKQARAELSQSVMGQDKAVDAVVTMLTSARVGLQMTGSAQNMAPKGVFFFVGPTGVGKTELAKALTKLVFGDEKAFARFDMSEYKEEHAAEKLAGAPPGFVGYDEGGQLTNRVMRQPHSILLFDEIEKAHPKVLDKFLQILEDGRLTDGKGQTAYFNQTAIIFTSNIGSSDLTDVQTGNIIRSGIMNRVKKKGVDKFAYEDIRQHFMDEVQWYFTSRIGRAELLNRLGDNIVVFDMLRPEHIRGISEKFVRLLAESAREKYKFELDVDTSWFDFLHERILESDNIMLGGRRIKTLTSTYLRDKINEWIFSNVPNTEELAGKTLKIKITHEGEMEAYIV
jgi:energy-coupling factor transporter ATP-binding protein EcfA2